MFNITDYLKRFSKLEKQSKDSNDAINTALKDVCGINDIKFELRRGVLYIKANSTAQALVFIKKGALLRRLSENPDLKIIDVR
ncbi:MAG: hypothetical protein Q8L64_06435 [bacterium]|nr:hypothetical protein [bacterium]